MVQTLLPRDAHNQSIQVMAPIAASTLSIGVSPQRTTSDFTSGVKVVELRPTVSCYIKFGDSVVDATSGDFFLSANERVTYHAGTNTRVSVIQDSNAGLLHVTELA